MWISQLPIRMKSKAKNRIFDVKRVHFCTIVLWKEVNELGGNFKVTRHRGGRKCHIFTFEKSQSNYGKYVNMWIDLKNFSPRSARRLTQSRVFVGHFSRLCFKPIWFLCIRNIIVTNPGWKTSGQPAFFVVNLIIAFDNEISFQSAVRFRTSFC